MLLALEVGACLVLTARITFTMAVGLPWSEVRLLISGGVQLLTIVGLVLGGVFLQGERGRFC